MIASGSNTYVVLKNHAVWQGVEKKGGAKLNETGSCNE